MRRGDIFWADLTPRSGSEQSGRRPVIIVSHDAFNATLHWSSIVVVPVSTSQKQAARGPTAVALPAGAGALPHPSVALCHQVTTLDRAKLTEQIGSLSPGYLRDVGEGLKAALDLD